MDEPDKKPTPDPKELLDDVKLNDLDKARAENRARLKFYAKRFGLIALVLVALWTVLWVRGSLTKTLVSEQWHRVVVASYSIEDALAISSEETQLDELRSALTLLEREAGDAAFQADVASGLIHSSDSRVKLAELATAVAGYAETCANGLAAVRSGSIDPVAFSQLASTELSINNQYDLFKNNLKRDDPLPREALDCSQFLQSLDNRYQQELRLTEEQQQAAADQAAAEQEALTAERAAVQTSIETFIDGQVEGDPAKVESVMTTGYAREYDFDALRDPRHQAYRVAYYRINDIAKATDGDYEVVVSNTYRSTFVDENDQTQSFDQTQQLTLEVTLGPGGERWLINREIK